MFHAPKLLVPPIPLLKQKILYKEETDPSVFTVSIYSDNSEVGIMYESNLTNTNGKI